jgi:hypothetical protein
VDVFACPVCEVAPELVTEGGAQLAIVRHQQGCPTLLAQTRTRWPPAPGALNVEAIARLDPFGLALVGPPENDRPT